MVDRRSASLVAPLLALALGGCANGEDAPSGPQALDFNGEGSCAKGPVASANFGDEITIEGWVRADPDAGYREHALLAWPGAFALFQNPDGVLYFTDGTDADAGPSGFGDYMDGTLHHVAAQWVNGTSAVYLDGERLGTNTLAEFGVEPGGQVFVGCWPERGMVHEGLIDEVRISGVARYDDGGFEPPEGPFTTDDDTFVLWHMDEGTGDTTVDAVAGVRLSLEAVDWVPFRL